MIKVLNLKKNIDESQIKDHELFDDLLAFHSDNKTTRIERIVSKGQGSDKADWYNQSQSEWVILLSGAAKIEFSDPDQVVDLKPFDYITIAAHHKHRVVWTDPHEYSIWLAVFGDF